VNNANRLVVAPNTTNNVSPTEDDALFILCIYIPHVIGTKLQLRNENYCIHKHIGELFSIRKQGQHF